MTGIAAHHPNAAHPLLQGFNHGSSKATAGTTARRWLQTFKVGYIQQAFTRACVREALRHGPENAPYLQRSDRALVTKGKASQAASSKLKGLAEGESPRVTPSIVSLCEQCE